LLIGIGFWIKFAIEICRFLWGLKYAVDVVAIVATEEDYCPVGF